MDKTKIEWTDATWNPVRGCSLVSAGCTNCYAMRVAHRSFTSSDMPYHGLTRITGGRPVWNGEIKLVRSMLRQPLVWKRPRRIFVNSMSDLFHEKVPFDFIDDVFEVMLQAHWHTFQILTKRPERMLEWAWSTNARHGDLLGCPGGGKPENPPKNIWLGVSVEDQAAANERIPLLLEMPASVRWISAEPLLGSVQLAALDCGNWTWDVLRGAGTDKAETTAALGGISTKMVLGGRKLDWVVVGGESGPGARPMNPQWARDLRDQCVDAGVPFFFKQWGDWLGGEDDGFTLAQWQDGETGKHSLADKAGVEWHHFGTVGEPGAFALRIGKKAAGRLLDGRTWDEYPQ